MINEKNVIYKATNKINGKIYIGLTTRRFKDRLRNHRNGHKNPNHPNYYSHFYYSMRKHGFENFEWEAIDKSDTKEELEVKEMYWISHFDSYNNGYNSTLGGECNSGYKMSEEQKKHLSNIKTGISVHTEESLKLLSEATSGINNPRCQPVVKLTKEGEYIKEYEFISDALESIGKTDISHIVKCCRGKLNMAHGFKWMYKDDYNKYVNGEIKISVGKHSRSVVQLTLDGEFIAEYPTLKDGGKAIDAHRSGIGKCCAGKQSSYKGYKWMYKDEYMKMTS
ncbi:hypothetical protein CN984_12485 [Bacillus cereus]|uniref:Uncharacterized protein n=1 Tax=Bacillus cereus TaxID=1396 RepID=A0A2B9Q435_BACCE|nr:GIY-YIG nuclease family protein [Bacillus cereus]PEA25923.1 hypothetical protein CON44_18470 [Bacillus cereus]PGO29235.1 hypothetical protein CN984_12485 [Bacillus cereus]